MKAPMPLGFALADKSVEYVNGIVVPIGQTLVELISAEIPTAGAATEQVFFTLSGGNIQPAAVITGDVFVTVAQRPKSGTTLKPILELTLSPKLGRTSIPLCLAATVKVDSSVGPSDLVISWRTDSAILMVGPGSIALNCVGLGDQHVDAFVKGQGTSSTLSGRFDINGIFKKVAELDHLADSGNDGGEIMVVGCAGTAMEGLFGTVASFEVRLREYPPSGQPFVSYYSHWEDGVFAQQSMVAGSRGMIVGAYPRKATQGVTIALEIKSDGVNPLVPQGEFISLSALQAMHASQAPQPFLGHTRFVYDHPVFLTSLFNPLGPPIPHMYKLGPVGAGAGVLQAYACLGSAFYEPTATTPGKTVQMVLYDWKNNTMAWADIGRPVGPLMLCAATRSLPPASSTSALLIFESRNQKGRAQIGEWGILAANRSAFLTYVYEPK